MRGERTCASLGDLLNDRDTLQTHSFRLDSAQLLYDLVTDNARQAFASSGAPPGASHRAGYLTS